MILFVDDEPRYVDSYVQELKMSGFDVSLQTSADSAFKFLEENKGKTEPLVLDLMIVDVMMPSGKTLKDANTQDGLRTGVRLYERMRAQLPDLPVLVLTNVSDPEVERMFAKERNCLFLRKDQCLPFELAERIKELIGGAGRGSEKGGEHGESR